jgi:hypothetical protein
LGYEEYSDIRRIVRGYHKIFSAGAGRTIVGDPQRIGAEDGCSGNEGAVYEV